MMGQMVMIDEIELSKLKQKSNILDEYFESIDRLMNECYPDIDIWIDTGGGYDVQLAVLHDARVDLRRYRSKNIWKHERMQKRNGKHEG